MSSCDVPSSTGRKIGDGALAAQVDLPHPSMPKSKIRSGLSMRPLVTDPSFIRGCCAACGFMSPSSFGQWLDPLGEFWVYGRQLPEVRRVVDRADPAADVPVGAE